MTPADYIRSIVELPAEAQAAYIQATLPSYGSSFWVSLLSALTTHLKSIGSVDSQEFIANRTVLEKVIANVPEDYKGSADATRKALSSELVKVLGLEAYPMRFLAADKLTMINNGDPRIAYESVFRLLDKGSTIEGAVYNVLIRYLKTLAYDDVDKVIWFIAENRQRYPGSANVEAFLDRLERDLQIRGLAKVWGPSLRRQYARELVQSRVIEDKDISVLIIGPTGTSKTFIAKRIAENSDYPEIHIVNCAHPKGAEAELEAGFSDARSKQITLLLDEVYALPLNLQEACLAEFGSALLLRIISTSSHSVEFLSENLKPDFWYRIDGWRFKLHPLADSPEDLAEAILGWAAENRVDVEPRIVELLRMNYAWPGNHREVKKVMYGLCKLCEKRKTDRLGVDLIIEASDELDDLGKTIFGQLFHKS